jgi:hypothetical protein
MTDLFRPLPVGALPTVGEKNQSSVVRNFICGDELD